MKVGVFTPLLSSLPLEDVLKKLKALGIGMVEFGTGNYPGDAHCKLSMLDNASELATFTSPEESVVGVRFKTAPPSSMHRPFSTQSRTKTEQNTRGTVSLCANIT